MVWAGPAGGPPEQGPGLATRLTLKPRFCFSAFVSQASATMHLPAAVGESSRSPGTHTERPQGQDSRARFLAGRVSGR